MVAKLCAPSPTDFPYDTEFFGFTEIALIGSNVTSNVWDLGENNQRSS